MRKTIITPGAPEQASSTSSEWLDIETLAHIEITSEDELFPIEHALGAQPTTGWRAANTGPQIIRLLFDVPQVIRRIFLHVIERSAERMQEFSIYAGSTTAGLSEVRRQQFTFSPGGSTEEIEDFSVQLTGVNILELRIDPDRSHDPKLSQNYATLVAFKLSAK